MSQTPLARLQSRRWFEPAAAVAITLLVLLVSFEVRNHESGGTTPAAIVFNGILEGLIDGLSAAGLILAYQTLRIINFAQLGVGVGGALLCFNLVYMVPGLPFPLAILAGLLGGAVVGALFQITFGLRFARSPRLVLTLATLFGGVFFAQSVVPLVQQLPGFPPIARRSSDIVRGALDTRPFLPFPKFHFTVGNLDLHFGFAQIFVIGLSLALLAGLGVFLYRTRMGRAIRAVAENAERASLLGISSGGIGLVVWAVVGALSAGALILRGFNEIPGVVYTPQPELLLGPIAAAVLARMRSINTAVLFAIAYNVLQQTIKFQQGDLLPIFDLVLFAALTVGLLVRGRRLVRGDEGSSWEATQEVRPVPRELARLPLMRATKFGAILLAVVALLGYPFLVGADAQVLGSGLMLSGIVVVSLVVLTGWSGQASAGQFALAAVGGIFAAIFASNLGLSFWLAVPLAAAMTGACGALLAFPALRVRGLFLLASTYAFAVMAQALFFDSKLFSFIPQAPAKLLHRPTLFLLDFDDEKSMYFLCAIALLVVVVIAVNLRRSRLGRVIIAVRDNEGNARSAGINPTWVKVSAFAVAGTMAGLAGAIFVFQQRGVIAGSFGVDVSLTLLIFAVVGGMASITGALIGLLGLTLVDNAIQSWAPAAVWTTHLIPLVVLYVATGGLIAMYARARDAVLRIIAERNHLVVPSLFADMDPEALHLRLIPLAVNRQASGWSALRRRFEVTSSRLNRNGTGTAQAAAGSAGDSAALVAAAGDIDDGMAWESGTA